MRFSFNYTPAELLYEEYNLYKLKNSKRQLEAMKQKCAVVMWPIYSRYGYLATQVFSEEFKTNEWSRIQMVFENTINASYENSWKSNELSERNYFKKQLERMLEHLIRHLRAQEESDNELDLSSNLVYYESIDYVVWHKCLKEGAYRLHSYCYDISHQENLTYDIIKEDAYQDNTQFDFYCRTEPYALNHTSNKCLTKIEFTDWLSEWDLERMSRFVKLIDEKLPAAYRQYFNPTEN